MRDDPQESTSAIGPRRRNSRDQRRAGDHEVSKKPVGAFGV